MHGLYELKKGQSKMCETNCRYDEIEVARITSEVTGTSVKGRIMSIFWNFITAGKAKVYLIRNSERTIIHQSFVIPKCYKFPFLRRGRYHDIEIGPCATREDYRGKSLYPYVLSNIISRELQDGDLAYMLIADSNISSIRGAAKVGFYRTGEIKKDKMGRHIIARR